MERLRELNELVKEGAEHIKEINEMIMRLLNTRSQILTTVLESQAAINEIHETMAGLSAKTCTPDCVGTEGFDPNAERLPKKKVNGTWGLCGNADEWSKMEGL